MKRDPQAAPAPSEIESLKARLDHALRPQPPRPPRTFLDLSAEAEGDAVQDQPTAPNSAQEHHMNASVCPSAPCRLGPETQPATFDFDGGREHIAKGLRVYPGGDWWCPRCGALGNAADLADPQRLHRFDPARPVDLVPKADLQVWNSAHSVADHPEPAVLKFLLALSVDHRTIDADTARWIGPWAALPREYVTPAGVSWAHAGVRLLLPACDLHGRIRSLLGLRLDPGALPSLLPAGANGQSFVVACGRMRGLLSGAAKQPAEVVLANGPLGLLAYLAKCGDGERLPVIAPAIASNLDPESLVEQWERRLALRFARGAIKIAALSLSDREDA